MSETKRCVACERLSNDPRNNCAPNQTLFALQAESTSQRVHKERGALRSRLLLQTV